MHAAAPATGVGRGYSRFAAESVHRVTLHWGTGQVIVLEVSTQTFLTDPSSMGREWQFMVPAQSA